MKVIILGTAWPYRGGLATFSARLARQFQQEGHDVEVWTFTLQYPSFFFPGKTQYTFDPGPSDLHIVRRLNTCNPLNWFRVARLLVRQQPDMLICCYWRAFFAPLYGTVCRLVRRGRHTRCVALVHNMFPHEKRVFGRLFPRYFVGSQDAFVALSQSVANDIRTLTAAPIAWSAHPIYDHYGARLSKSEACAQLGLDASKQYMLFFGLVRSYKGLDLIIDALGQVKEQLPDVQLLVAGEFYEGEDKYRRQIARAGLDGRVLIRNEFISDSELALYFGAADLITQPYKSATQSGVTQVALHFEKPMLVTNVGGLGEIVHHDKMGYAVLPDSEAIAQSLLDYFLHGRQAAFTEYLRKEKVHYRWDQLTAAFENML